MLYFWYSLVIVASIFAFGKRAATIWLNALAVASFALQHFMMPFTRQAININQEIMQFFNIRNVDSIRELIASLHSTVILLADSIVTVIFAAVAFIVVKAILNKTSTPDASHNSLHSAVTAESDFCSCTKVKEFGITSRFVRLNN